MTINIEIQKIIQRAKKDNINLTPDQALNYLTLQYLCLKEEDLNSIWGKLDGYITDGANDGGIDFVYFDEEENKIIVGQNKYSENINIDDCVMEVQKIINTLNDFTVHETGQYNHKLINILSNAIDRLSEDYEGNVEILFTSLNSLNEDKVYARTENDLLKIAGLQIIDQISLNENISKVQAKFDLVNEAKIVINEAKNYLTYSNREQEGIIVNISSKSIVNLYNQYYDKGLFNLNIRKFVRNKSVDDGIKSSLNKDRENFWFLNNGITIACEDYHLDGNTVKLYEFSIVNGGQTTSLIARDKGKKLDEFFIPCKIIKPKNDLEMEEKIKFFNKIAEATNSQKPIQPKDLKANAPEMIQLQRSLLNERIYLEIKRGESTPKNIHTKIKNDELAQSIFSFVVQRPGTARSNKNALFNNPKFYKSIFMMGYSNDLTKREFLIDLIKLHDRLDKLYKEYRVDGIKDFSLNTEEANVFLNGKYVILAILGLVYRIVNDDVEVSALRDDPYILESSEFIHGKFLSNYQKDDLDSKMMELIKLIVTEISDEYETKFKNGEVTSVSNFFKTDKKYVEDIVKRMLKFLNRKKPLEEVMELGEFLKRN